MIRPLREHAAPAIVLVVALAAYVRTLAPTVTFEDSGELVTAAWLLGAAHEPGYPLYTLIAHAFTGLPFGTIAWRVALLSAVGMALGAAFVAAAVHRALLRAIPGSDESGAALARDLVAGAAGLVAAFAVAAWQQAVIVEVYGLNFALTAALFYLSVRWAQAPDDAARHRILYGTSFLLGMALGHHPTVSVLAPALLLFAALTGLRRILSWRTAALAIAALATGLLPLAYLPLASAANPALDWGDPETAGNFLHVVTRAQYGLAPWPDVAEAGGRLLRFLALAREQWPLPAFALVLAGVAWLWRAERRLLALATLVFLAAGPATAMLIDTPLNSGDPEVDAENRAIVSVFFIPAYGGLAFLAGCGLGGLLALAPARWRTALAAVTLVLPLSMALASAPRLDFSAHRWAEAYAENLFHDAAPGALVLTPWDPFYFPAVYFQEVEGRRTDLVIVDPELLRRSWYVRQLLRHQALMRAVPVEAGRFLAAVAPFENGEPYDGVGLERAYVELQVALIDAARAQGREVLATRPPGAEVLRGDALEPLVAAYALVRGPVRARPLRLSDYRLAEFMDPRLANDRMAVMMRRHFGEMLRERALLLVPGTPEAGEAARRALTLLQAPGVSGASPR